MTAKLSAYYRQFTGIAFVAEAAAIVGAGDAFEQLVRDHGLDRDKLAFYAPMFEARYKSITPVLSASSSSRPEDVSRDEHAGLVLRGKLPVGNSLDTRCVSNVPQAVDHTCERLQQPGASGPQLALEPMFRNMSRTPAGRSRSGSG